MSSLKDDTALVEKAQAGDPAATQILLLRHVDQLNRELGEMLQDTVLSIDTLQQQTIARVGSELRRFRASEELSFHEWLLRLAQDEVAKALCATAQSGDENATDRLFHLYEAEVKEYLASRLSQLQIDTVSADDIWHHVRFRVERRLPYFAYDRKRAFVRYLFVTARHCCSDLLRERQSVSEELLVGSAIAWIVDSDPSPSSVVAQRQRNDAMRDAIKKLTGRDFQAIVAHLEGKTNAEIAAQLKTTPGAVRALLQRTRVKLHDDLGGTAKWFSDG